MRSLFLAAVLETSALMAQAASFSSTIPVVDMNEFENPDTRQKFIDEMAQALHDVGFFAVINPGIDIKALNEGYASATHFFTQPLELKNEIYFPELNGQRGYVPSERAQGFALKDCKEFLHIGRHGNKWPTWMDLQTPMDKLLDTLDERSQKLQQAISLAIGQHIDFVSDITKGASSLMRVLHYPANPAPGVYWAAPHTDIDFFTILPKATEEGLQVFQDGQWISVLVPEDAFIVNGGDVLENMTNGYFKSATHHVMAKPDVERYSIVYFIHAKDFADVSPLPYCIDLTGGAQHFPQATEMDLLARRLVELDLAGSFLREYDANSGLIERVQALVESGQAADAVKKTYSVWQSLQQKPSTNE